MKKLISLTVSVLLIITTFAGCSFKLPFKLNKKYDRENMKKGTSDYVELCDVESNFYFDETDSTYQANLSNLIDNDLSNSKYYKDITEGPVADGDVTNIDYAGSVKGVAFTGGTAKSQQLTIGSGQFISGFEEQLIGVNVGETVTITVTFPEGYADSTDLETGKNTIKMSNTEAQFVVTVNSIKRPYSSVDDEFAAFFEFSSADQYYEARKKEALALTAFSKIEIDSDIFDYPEEDEGTPYTYYKNYYTAYAQYYNSTFENFLSLNNITETEFRQSLLKEVIIAYALFDEYRLSLEDNEVEDKISQIAEDENSTEDAVINNYTKAMIEFDIVYDKVLKELQDRSFLNN